jgi:pectinesterase
MHCTFPEIMQNKPIEHVVYKDNPKKNRPYIYGDRYFFYECSRTGGNFDWFANNLNEWPHSVSPEMITPAWTFDDKWNPVDTTMLIVTKKERMDSMLYLWFNELVMPVGDLIIETKSGAQFTYFRGSGRDRLELIGTQPISDKDLEKSMRIVSGQIQNIQATVVNRLVSNEF